MTIFQDSLYMTIFKDSLYVTDWRLDAIVRMNKESGSDATIVEKVEESNRLYGEKHFISHLYISFVHVYSLFVHLYSSFVHLYSLFVHKLRT